MLKPIELAHEFLCEVIKLEDTVVDATMGNGNDTAFLAKLSAHVFAFDVQEAAITATKKLLSAQNLSAQLILDGHENVKKYVKNPVKAAIFNLGYLPRTDKTVITHAETTIKALSDLTEMLDENGRIAVMIYYKHDGGNDEKNAVLAWAEQLDQKKYQAARYNIVNEAYEPPILLLIERKSV